MKKTLAKLSKRLREFREFDKRIAADIEYPLKVAFVVISGLTFFTLMFIAWNFPLSDTYTINHRLSYVLQGIAAFIALLLSFKGKMSNSRKGLLVLVIELYLLGLLFQLFTLVL